MPVFSTRGQTITRRGSSIERIIIKGEWLEGEEVKTGVVNAFKDLLTNPGDWRTSSKGLIFSRVDGSEAAFH